MSLLLDARKKSQGGNDSRQGLALALEPLASAVPSSPHTANENARSASQNLFQAKAVASSGGHVNRTLIYALLGSIVLFCLGALYVWYEINAMSSPAPRSLAQTAAVTPPPVEMTRAQITPAHVSQLIPEISPDVAAPAQTPVLPPTAIAAPNVTAPRSNVSRPAKTLRPKKIITITRDPADSLDKQLSNAYLAYKAGRYEQAQYLYRSVLAQEPHNIDSLLGMAAIAQQAGVAAQAQQYYVSVLNLDPRNAVANAGMSTLSPDENRESRLKMLINEQNDSSSLHFALANHYAGQQRWAAAQQSYFKAYQLDPNNSVLAFNLAISLERLGQNRPAAQYYRRAIALDKGNNAGFDHTLIEQRAQKLTQ